MSELLNIQRVLQRHLIDPAALEFKETLDAVVLETGSVSRDVRLHIYANAYRERIVEALSVDFGMLHTYLGDAEFTKLIHVYIDQHPSHYFSLRGVGSDLADFLRTIAPYAEHIELFELAAFEWALCHAFDAADACCASGPDFSTLKPEQWSELMLQFVPALSLCEFRTNAPAIWKTLNGEQALPVVEILVESQYWLVWRSELKLLFRAMDSIEKIAVTLFRSGATFADVCGELAERLPEDEVPQRVAMLLQQWLRDGLIAKP